MFITSIGSVFGPESIAVTLVSSATVPGAPSITSVTEASPTSVTVNFTAPSSNGGSPITKYTAVSSPGSLTATVTQSGSGSVTVTGLTTGTAYTFVVYATNSVGNSANSTQSSSITPISQGWVAAVTTSAPRIVSIAVDSANNILATSGNSAYTGWYTQSFTSAGAVNFAYNYPAYTDYWPDTVALERTNSSTANTAAVYVQAATGPNSTFSYSDIIKLNNSGSSATLAWHVRITPTSLLGTSGDYYSMSADHTGPAVITIQTNPTVHKFTTAGALSWQKQITGLASEYAYSVCQRESNTYFAVVSFASNPGNGFVMFNFSSSGSTNWERQISAPTSGTYLVPEAIDVDNNANVIIGGRCTYITNGSTIISLSASGSTTNWAYTIADMFVATVHYSKSQTVIYLAGYQYSVGTGACIIIKMDTSGNVLWKNVLSSVTAFNSSYEVYTGVNDTTYFYLCTGGGSIFKLPASGAQPTISGYTYASATNTFTSFTPNNTAGGGTISAGGSSVSGANTSPALSTVSISTSVTNF